MIRPVCDASASDLVREAAMRGAYSGSPYGLRGRRLARRSPGAGHARVAARALAVLAALALAAGVLHRLLS